MAVTPPLLCGGDGPEAPLAAFGLDGAAPAAPLAAIPWCRPGLAMSAMKTTAGVKSCTFLSQYCTPTCPQVQLMIHSRSAEDILKIHPASIQDPIKINSRCRQDPLKSRRPDSRTEYTLSSEFNYAQHRGSAESLLKHPLHLGQH